MLGPEKEINTVIRLSASAGYRIVMCIETNLGTPLKPTIITQILGAQTKELSCTSSD